MTTTTTPTSGSAIKRYKIGYHSDEWGVRSSTPSGIPDASGPWVRYEDHVTALKAAQPVVTSQPGVAYEALPDPWREKLAELAGQLEKCGVAWMIRTNGGTTYNVGRADGAMVATSELRKVLNDELVNMLTAAPTHQPAPQPSPAAQGDALDAARYRFLRDGEWRDTDLEPFIRLQLNTLWDAKIDAALAAQGGSK